MYCLRDYGSILIHVLLYLNVFVFLGYTRMTKYKRGTWWTMLWLKLCLIVLFFIALETISGATYTDVNSAFSVIVAAVIFSLTFFEHFSAALTTTMIALTAQLSVAFIPTWLNKHIGIPMETSESITLLLPFILVFLFQLAARVPFFQQLFTIMVLSWITTVAFNVVYDQKSVTLSDEVCCDMSTNGECAIAFGWLSWVVFFTLCTLLVIGNMRVLVRRYKEWRVRVNLDRDTKRKAAEYDKLSVTTNNTGDTEALLPKAVIDTKQESSTALASSRKI
jgi:hypothetical protein